MSSTVFAASMVLYLVVPWPLLIKGWPLRAGLGMLLAALLPLTWQGLFSDSDAPGFGIMLLLTAPIPLVLIAVGIAMGFYRYGALLVCRFAKRGL